MNIFLKNGINLIFGVAKYLYWYFLNIGYRWKIFSIYRVPVVINNFNRLTYPLKLIAFLEKCGLTNIMILDNSSTYPPLLKYYETCTHPVIREPHNYGHLAFWKSGLYNRYKWNYFVYTDSDVVPIEECPINFIEYFKEILDKNHRLDKIGFGIKVDDLPDSFSLKNSVIDYEKRYWQKEVSPNIYDAPIDTTFALYKPLSALKGGQAYTLSAFRAGFPYVVRHLPWYIDSENLSEEEWYYIKTCNESSSIGQHQSGTGKVY
ncbi:MAG: glycosyltransferase family 2 protein [Bacteroidota bacterium]